MILKYQPFSGRKLEPSKKERLRCYLMELEGLLWQEEERLSGDLEISLTPYFDKIRQGVREALKMLNQA